MICLRALFTCTHTATKIRLVREHGSIAQGRACRVDDQQGIPLRKRATQGWNLMLRKHWLGYLPASATPLDWPFRFWYRYRPLSISTMSQKPADIPAETLLKVPVFSMSSADASCSSSCNSRMLSAACDRTVLIAKYPARMAERNNKITRSGHILVRIKAQTLATSRSQGTSSEQSHRTPIRTNTLEFKRQYNLRAPRLDLVRNKSTEPKKLQSKQASPGLSGLQLL